jgi:glycosyltransferase involved in cell wall biosynthesis
MTERRISVVISTLNRSTDLAHCLGALEKQTVSADGFEVQIVDNGSTDETSSLSADFCARNANFSYFVEHRRGLAAARNAGVRRSASAIVAFTDDDAMPEPTWLERLLGRFDGLPDDVAAIGGDVYPVWEVERPAWLTDAMLRPLSAGLLWSASARVLRPGEWLVEVNSAYRKHPLLKFGGFPEHLGRVGEILLSGENCVNRVMQRAGLRLFYDPAIVVRHRIPASRLTRAWFRRRMFWQGVTMNLLNRHVEEQSSMLGLNLVGGGEKDWEEIVVPTSAWAWADLFDDKSPMPFQEQLDIIEQFGYLLESQSVVIGR